MKEPRQKLPSHNELIRRNDDCETPTDEANEVSTERSDLDRWQRPSSSDNDEDDAYVVVSPPRISSGDHPAISSSSIVKGSTLAGPLTPLARLLWRGVFEPAMTSRWRRLISVIFIAVCLAPYTPMIRYKGFIMDDSVAIVRNLNVVGESVSWSDLNSRDFWGLNMFDGGWTHKSFRPITTITYRWNYILHGLDSSGFHVANFLLHAAVSFLMIPLCTIVLGAPRLLAVIGAALFACHPVHTENLLYLVCRADILAALFAILSIVLYISAAGHNNKADSGLSRNEEGPHWVLMMSGCLLACLLAVAGGLSKEAGFTVLPILVGIEVFALVAVPQRWETCELLAGYPKDRHGTDVNMSPQDNPVQFETDRLTRMLTYAFLHGQYLKLLILPMYLCYDYSLNAIPMLRSFQDCRLLLPLASYLLIACLLAVGLRLLTTVGLERSHQCSRERGKNILIGLAVLIVTWFPASNVMFPVGTVIGERLLYIPSIGFIMLVVTLLESCASRRSGLLDPGISSSASFHGYSTKSHVSLGLKAGAANAIRSQKTSRKHWTKDRQPQSFDSSKSEHRGTSGPLSLGFTVFILIPVFCTRTFLRVLDWSDPDVLFVVDGVRQPSSAKTQFNLGITYMQQQKWDEAVGALVRCALADPMSGLPYWRIGQIEILRGNFPAAEQWLMEATTKFGASLMVKDEEIFHDAAVALYQNGKVEMAMEYLHMALTMNPDFPKGLNNLACATLGAEYSQGEERGRYDAVDRAAHYVSQAIQLSEASSIQNPLYWQNMLFLAKLANNMKLAKSAESKLSEIIPDITPNDLLKSSADCRSSASTF
ncbi:Protein O-mannosyl-transferase tmtc4 [Perkinsus olseni]|uniref:dolichyl-phosphate-mannose--protein mannosyltransferase n=2 Tax=Perkinsus olseni TaxID=32597 RepID=A0A7J6PH17_PEROL|nr:Protein O-mannosyl-transferase tmtc4 [Perkinsus olseni]